MHHYAVTIAVTSKKKLPATSIARLVTELLDVGFADAAATADTDMASSHAKLIADNLTISDAKAVACPSPRVV